MAITDRTAPSDSQCHAWAYSMVIGAEFDPSEHLVHIRPTEMDSLPMKRISDSFGVKNML